MITYDIETQSFINLVDGTHPSDYEIKEYYETKINNSEKEKPEQTCTPKEWDSCRVEKMRLRWMLP